MYKYHFVSECFEIDAIMDDMDKKFFNAVVRRSLFASVTPFSQKQSTRASSQGP